MTLTALGLVLLSAFFHAVHDLFAKRSENKQVFSWWHHLVGWFLILPLFA